MRVLHVTESLGGGVATALEDYISHTPELDHYVLASRRPGTAVGDRIEELAVVTPMVAGHARRRAQVTALAGRLRPQVVHAHSSFAGAYVRSARLPGSTGVVYTPHCFAMERTDLHQFARRGLRVVESLLSSRTDCLAGVSGREVELAATFFTRPPSVEVPNVARIPANLSRERFHRGPLQAVGMGRLCAQKDPEFFALAARAAAEYDIEWSWIGGGDEHYADVLRDAGVKVTGWVERAEALRLLAQADAYVHSAAWEGAPLTILEAAALRLPVIARHSEAVAGLGVPTVATPVEMAGAVASLRDEERREAAAQLSDDLTRHNAPERQRDALLRAYRMAFDRARLRGDRRPKGGPRPGRELMPAA